MLAKKLLGKEVIGSRGDKIGKIADFDIDLVSGKVKFAVISSGLNKKYKIKLDDVVTAGDTVIIRLTLDDLKDTLKKTK
ncbi:MAG: PRC-barrel domain-containing protein [Dehalococcoidia bacterium]|nr:PRC-barrel domain-containing protein [Dehalococcoidia bacterium]